MRKRVDALQVGDKIASVRGFSQGRTTFVIQAVVPVPNKSDLRFVIMVDDNELKRDGLNEDSEVQTDVSSISTEYEMAEKEIGIVGVLWVDCPKCGAKAGGSLCHDADGSLLTSGPQGGLAAHAEREVERMRLEMAWATDKGE